jgi:hypothetical protein
MDFIITTALPRSLDFASVQIDARIQLLSKNRFNKQSIPATHIQDWGHQRFFRISSAFTGTPKGQRNGHGLKVFFKKVHSFLHKVPSLPLEFIDFLPTYFVLKSSEGPIPTEPILHQCSS